MAYTVTPAPILGPCPCRGCGVFVWWATRKSRYLGNVREDRMAWREDDGLLHRCPGAGTLRTASAGVG